MYCSLCKILDTAWRGQAGLDVSSADVGTRSWGDLLNRKGLVAGDLAALTLFAYVGRASHGMSAFDLGVVVTALPFLVGAMRVWWYIVAALPVGGRWCVFFF